MDYVQDVLIQSRCRARRPATSVGVALIRRLLREFGGTSGWPSARGTGARAVREHGLYPETKVFVDNVLALRTRV